MATGVTKFGTRTMFALTFRGASWAKVPDGCRTKKVLFIRTEWQQQKRQLIGIPTRSVGLYWLFWKPLDLDETENKTETQKKPNEQNPDEKVGAAPQKKKRTKISILSGETGDSTAQLIWLGHRTIYYFYRQTSSTGDLNISMHFICILWCNWREILQGRSFFFRLPVHGDPQFPCSRRELYQVHSIRGSYQICIRYWSGTIDSYEIDQCFWTKQTIADFHLRSLILMFVVLAVKGEQRHRMRSNVLPIVGTHFFSTNFSLTHRSTDRNEGSSAVNGKRISFWGGGRGLMKMVL